MIRRYKPPKAVLDDFIAQRFGLLFIGDPVTLQGAEIGWSRDENVRIDDYDTLYQEFNPALFDADE